MDISERAFEATIESALLAGGPDAPPEVRESPVAEGGFEPGGYRKRVSKEHYDKALCLDPAMVLAFIHATQPEEWENFRRQHGGDARERFLKRLAQQVRLRGTLDVLRKGIKADGCRFELAHFRPVSGMNPKLEQLYQGNIFTVIRQLEYNQRDAKTIDLVLFLNGLPILTAELKNPLTGQNVQSAIRQYSLDRDPREPLFGYGQCLAHFAVDPDLVYLATHLEGGRTRFTPFNQGRNGGAGNPPAWRGFATAYLWEQVWARDSVLNLIQHFIEDVEVEDEKGRKTGQRMLIFPRYHQLDSVRRLTADAKERGTGRKYLIQHSAGSGKSNSIAWLAHQLATLHDANDRRVFDSVVVITDRRVLDRQLQRTVLQFEQVLGVVENIDKTSRQLKQALEDGKKIIVTTLQKFPVIAGEISALPGKQFAVIVDEAHSSQTGESTKSLKQVLSAGTLEEAEAEEAEAPEEDWEDRIAAEMRSRGPLPNVSYFAFTATPKSKTLELFGTQRRDGSYLPFSLYTMRQAIEEGYILDVLENYTTYGEYWNLLKKIEDDPRYDKRQAVYLLRSFVSLHEHTVAEKVAIMVEHFNSHVRDCIGGQAKAMIVTRSRLHAVRYKMALDRYLREHGYPLQTLVAFSGTVRDAGVDYTEAGMNGISETQTADTFARGGYRFLVVAYKFQTGFDQPLLHTMYVDQKLGGVQAVQTLSRLNRVHPGKQETMVLDFANEADDVKKAFEPYYDRTWLKEGTDPNRLYDLQRQLEGFHLYDATDVERFAKAYFNPRATQDRIHAAMAPVVERYEEADKEEQADSRGALGDYVRLYAFLSQLITFVDTDLEKLYVFGRLLLRKLPVPRERLPVEIQQAIDLDSYRIRQTASGGIGLERGAGELLPAGAEPPRGPPTEELEPLSQIIEELNQRFGAGLSEKDKVSIAQLEARLVGNATLEASARVNTPDNFRHVFNQVANDELQDMVDSNFRFYKQVNDDPEFAEHFLAWLFGRYMQEQSLGQPGRNG